MRRAAALVLLSVSGACYSHHAEETEVEELRFESGSDPISIEIRLEAGSIRVVGSDSDSIEAEFVKRARSLDSENARAALESIEVSGVEEGGRIRFEARTGSLPPFAADLRTDLTLRVPREVRLDAETGDGDVELRGIAGALAAETRDGRIRLEQVEGEIRLRSEDGSIRGRELAGEVEASTEDGDLELEGTFSRLRAVSLDGDIRIEARSWPEEVSDWQVRTSDGSVSVALPPTASAEIDATTMDGRIVNRISSLEGEEGDGRFRGKLGEGGPLLLLNTMDGRIELEER